MIFKKIFNYLEPAWTGNDKKISLRAILAIAFAIDFIRNLSHAIWRWDAGTSLEGVAMTLGIEAGLIVGLLGLTTYQNMQTWGKSDGSSGTYYQSTKIETQINKKDDANINDGRTDGEESVKL